MSVLNSFSRLYKDRAKFSSPIQGSECQIFQVPTYYYTRWGLSVNPIYRMFGIQGHSTPRPLFMGMATIFYTKIVRNIPLNTLSWRLFVAKNA